MAFESLSEKLSAAFKRLRSKGKLTEPDIKAAMREVRMALLEADVNYKVAKEFIARVTERSVGAEVMESLTPAQQVIKIVSEELTALMGSESRGIHINAKPPTVVMMCGLQGSGKTTHSAKIAKYFLKQGHRPLLVACDIYRPAAIDQLKVVGEKARVPVFELGAERPEVIVKKAYAHARDHGNDLVILDTAGRLHVDDELMAELSRIKEAVPVDETLLVIDAMVGQDAVNVASSFNEKVGVDGVVLTKLDGDTRGGAALSVRAVTGKPIKFAGVGEKLDDLEVFHPDRMASRILGMGDVMTLIEKAQETQDEKKAQEAAKRLLENKFDLNDLLDQIAQMKKMGGAAAMMSMLPGGAKVSESDLEGSDKMFKRMEAIIQSMTPAERAKPALIDPRRKRRIAAGSGTKVEDVNRILRQYEQMNKLMKQMKKRPKGGRRRFGGMGGMFG